MTEQRSSRYGQFTYKPCLSPLHVNMLTTYKYNINLLQTYFIVQCNHLNHFYCAYDYVYDILDS